MSNNKHRIRLLSGAAVLNTHIKAQEETRVQKRFTLIHKLRSTHRGNTITQQLNTIKCDYLRLTPDNESTETAGLNRASKQMSNTC